MEKKKKIVILGSAYPLRGGLAAYNERLAREYLSLGYEVELYTFSLQYPSFLFPGKTQYSSEPAPVDLNIKVSVNSINPFNWYNVGKSIKNFKPDLLIIKFWIPFMAPCLGTIARIVRQNKVTKIVSILDNIIPHEKRPGDRILAGYFVNGTDGFIAMSQNVLNDLKTFDDHKPVILCPHPLYDNFGKTMEKAEARKQLSLEANLKYILFFGFIRDYKGLDLLIRAMDDIRIRFLGIKLIVAGEFYTDSKPYFDLITQLKLGDFVIMSNDFIPDSKVGTYFCACDLVVQPYKHATQSGVTQIAYHFNKPMITTNVGGLEEIVPHEKVGYVVEPDPGAIAGAIEKFYREGKEDEFVANTQSEKIKYSWNRLVDQIDTLVKN